MDDPDVVDKYCPELAKLPILEGYTEDGKEILTKAKNRITLKMLLTHTSGEHTIAYERSSGSINAHASQDWHTALTARIS
jgi:methyl acetate hydrolase